MRRNRGPDDPLWLRITVYLLLGALVLIVAAMLGAWWVTSGNSCGGSPGSCWP